MNYERTETQTQINFKFGRDDGMLLNRQYATSSTGNCSDIVGLLFWSIRYNILNKPLSTDGFFLARFVYPWQEMG